MKREKLAAYGGTILGSGILQMRDPNDNAKHRYQYALIDGIPMTRTLPNRGDYKPPAQWTPIDLRAIAASHQGSNPILDYFASKERESIVEIYRLFDGLAGSVILAGAFLGSAQPREAIGALNEADQLADQIERKFELILSPEEREENDEDPHPKASGCNLRHPRR